MAYSIKPEKAKRLAAIVEDPIRFAESLLGLDLWSKQQEILQSIVAHARTAVKACHASGKTFLAAAAVLWFITRYREAIAVTTAPTWMQIERVLWREIHSIASRSKVAHPKPTATSLQLGPRRYAVGLSTDQGVRFQGYHADHILVVIDEAPGILPEIWEAIEGIRAGGDVRVLALGNPTISSGTFHDNFHADRLGWNLYTISAWDTPNLAGLKLSYEYAGERITLGDPQGRDLLDLSEEELDDNVRPYLTTRRWVKEKYLEWGPGHPLWEARVLGNFPTQSEDALLSLAWLEAAQTRECADEEPLQAGIDVAGPGEDETTLFVRRGRRIVWGKFWSDADPRGQLVAALAPYKAQRIQVKVDSAGIGYYLGQHLKDNGFEVEMVNVGESPRDSEKFSNLKAELYWGLRMRAQAGDLAGLTDEKTIGQLAGIRYKHNARGQVVIESKEEARKRGVKSPDRAEGLILAFAERRNPGIFDYYRAECEKQERELPGMWGRSPDPDPWAEFERWSNMFR